MGTVEWPIGRTMQGAYTIYAYPVPYTQRVIEVSYCHPNTGVKKQTIVIPYVTARGVQPWMTE